MNHMKKFMLSLLAFAFIGLVNSFAQKSLEEARIKYEVTNVKSDDPQMESMLNMMKGSVLEVTFNADKQWTKVDMMGGMVVMNTLNDVKLKKTTLLMDMMGRKIKVEGTDEEFKKMDGNVDPDDIEYEISYEKSNTKEIAGYPCYKAILSSKHDGVEMNLIAYVTDKLKAPKSVVRNVDAKQLDGLPLEYTVETMGFAMTYTATSVERKIDPSIFTVPDGYESMSFDEFINTMGAMGGGMGY